MRSFSLNQARKEQNRLEVNRALLGSGLFRGSAGRRRAGILGHSGGSCGRRKDLVRDLFGAVSGFDHFASRAAWPCVGQTQSNWASFGRPLP